MGFRQLSFLVDDLFESCNKLKAEEVEFLEMP